MNRLTRIVILSVLVVVLAGVVIWSQAKPDQDRAAGSEPDPIPVLGDIEDSGSESPYSLQFGARMGRIVDQQGNGVAGATVTFNAYLGQDCNGNPTLDPPVWQGTTVTTDEQGAFSFPPALWQVPEGEEKPTIRADIHADGFLPRNNARVGVNYAEDKGWIDLFRVGRIEGVVIDPNGHPLANAPVDLNTSTYYSNPGASCIGCYGGRTRTDAWGAFTFEKVPPGRHLLQFPGSAGRCQSDANDVIPYRAYATFRNISMEDGKQITNVFLDLRQNRSSVTGRVLDQQGRPMPGVQAVLQREMRNYFGSGWTSQTQNIKSVETDDHGRYCLQYIPAGDYKLCAQYPYEKGKNYESGKPITIYLAANQQVSFDLVLKRQDGSVPASGNDEESLFESRPPENLGPRQMVVVDPHGKGIGGTTIKFEPKITIEDHHTHQRTKRVWKGALLTTDSEGVFTLPEELQPIEGKWVSCMTTIKADGFEKRQTSLAPWHLKEGRRIDLLPLARIEGHLLQDGKPVRGTVQIRESLTAYKHPSSSMNSVSGLSTPTDENGRFMFEQIPEGVHVISCTINGSKNRLDGFEVVYLRGHEGVNDLIIETGRGTSTMHGRVLDTTGQAIQDATVRLCKPITWGYNGTCTIRPEFYQSESTGRNGEFRIDAVCPGVYEAEAVLQEGRRRTSERMMIAVGEGQSIDMDFRMNP